MQNVQSIWLKNNLWFSSALNDLDNHFNQVTKFTPTLSPIFEFKQYSNFPIRYKFNKNFTPILPIIEESDEDNYYIDLYYKNDYY